MSMHQGLDLSKFKKVSSDKKTSTLRHSGGHEIKIAHAGMSPKMRDHIAAMPVHMAEGGDVEETDDTEEEAPDTETEESSEPDTSEEGPPAPEEPAPAQAKKQAVDTDDPNTVVVQGHHLPPTAQELNQEDAHFQDDIMRGHIKPETIQSLYGKKDTLGKIGTLFGLLVSGMGSGLAGQPNAVLDQMNKEIQNDLEAQKNSNANAQNWYQLSLKHEMQKADIKQKAVQNELTKGQTSAIPSQIAQTEAHTEGLQQDAYGKALHNAEQKALIGVKLHLLGITDKLPDGPTKARAQQVYTQQVAPIVDAKIMQNNAQLSGQLQLKHAIKTQGEKQAKAGDGPMMVDTSKIQQLEQKWKQNEAFGINGLDPSQATKSMSPQQANAAREEAAMVNKNRLMMNTWKKTFEYLDKQAVGGKLNQENYNAAVTPLVAQMATSMPQAEAEAMGHGMFPTWKDWGDARDTKIKQTMDHFKTMESKTPNLEPFGLKPPFPAPPTLSKGKGSKKPSGQTSPAEQYKVVNGVKYKRGPKGEAIRVD